MGRGAKHHMAGRVRGAGGPGGGCYRSDHGHLVPPGRGELLPGGGGGHN